ncbi:MAG: SDR family oxidoreductase [Parachlamydiales bacterium]|nr:SDR family oxidoreductase [Parachlamydiales bacterium]
MDTRNTNSRFHEKVVIVTGANRGIGKQIAKQFVSEGAHVIITGKDAIKITAAAQDLEAIPFAADVSSEEDMKSLSHFIEKNYGRVDVLCHNAGIYPVVRLEDMSLDQWQYVINTNLNGTFLAFKMCIPFMKKQNFGKIVVVSSISGPKVGLPGCSHYTASKGGVAGFIRTAAIELAKYNINVNSVEPGNIITESFEDMGQDHIDMMTKAVPLGRLGTPKDIANSVLFLASKDADYITGADLVIDGGQILPESHFVEF